MLTISKKCAIEGQIGNYDMSTVDRIIHDILIEFVNQTGENNLVSRFLVQQVGPADLAKTKALLIDFLQKEKKLNAVDTIECIEEILKRRGKKKEFALTLARKINPIL